MTTNSVVPVFDGHNDALLRLHLNDDESPETFIEGAERGHLDLPRANAGGFAGGMFACFVPSRKGDRKRIKRTIKGYEESFPCNADIDRSASDDIEFGRDTLSD